jgi:hypothetical protein
MEFQMDERRGKTRDRVMFGATAGLPLGRTADCVVRNISDNGAHVSFTSPTLVPDTMGLTIERKGKSYTTRVVWTREKSAGVEFQDSKPFTGATTTAEIAAGASDSELEERLRASEKKARQLKNKMRSLLGQ